MRPLSPSSNGEAVANEFERYSVVMYLQAAIGVMFARLVRGNPNEDTVDIVPRGLALEFVPIIPFLEHLQGMGATTAF
jgi:hypothetical protein